MVRRFYVKSYELACLLWKKVPEVLRPLCERPDMMSKQLIKYFERVGRSVRDVRHAKMRNSRERVEVLRG